MNRKYLWIILIALFVFGTFAGVIVRYKVTHRNDTTNVVAIENWEGVYTFTETSVSDPSKTFEYELALTKDRNNYSTFIAVDGPDTLVRMNAVGIEAGGKLNLVFDSYNESYSDIISEYRRGDLLFSLVPTRENSFEIEWIKMQPKLYQNRSEDLIFTRISPDPKTAMKIPEEEGDLEPDHGEYVGENYATEEDVCNSFYGVITQGVKYDEYYVGGNLIGMWCLFAVSEDVSFNLNFDDNGIGLYNPDTQNLLQSIDIAPDMMDRYILGSISFEEDINFDGNRDLLVQVDSGAYNEIFNYWVYNPRSRQFEKDNVLGDVVNPAFDSEEKTIISTAGVGCAGLCYVSKVYEFRGTRYVQIREEEQFADNNFQYFTRTLRELRNGKLELVSTKTLSAEEAASE